MVLVKLAENRSRHGVLGSVLLSVYEDDRQRAIVVRHGEPGPEGHVPVRIQSSCTYGDTLLISDCDCRQQIEDTFRHFLVRRRGILIYLLQEDRGAGLAVKALACQRQYETGLDTVAAYEALGLPVDQRDYGMAVEILRQLNAQRIALLTNNPRKVAALSGAGLEVAREQLQIRVTTDNLAYLRTKQTRLGHQLGLAIPNHDRENRHTCFVIGAAVMDHVFQVRTNPKLGVARQAHHYQRRPGGKGFSQAVALARLGADATLLTVRGYDPDGDEIANVLAAEDVRAFFTGVAGGALTPQTVVLQPPGSAPTYVGWLGLEHRTLRQRPIEEREEEIQAANAVLITLEAAEDAIRHTVSRTRANSLVLLSASPVVEPPYNLTTDTLERLDILVGSQEELAALMPRQRRSRTEIGPRGEEIAAELARLCGITVVLTDFRSVRRRVIAVNPAVGEPVRIRSGMVRRIGVSDAIGTTDVFCAALALSALDLPGAADLPRRPGIWRGQDSPLAVRTNLIDVLMSALGAEAFVARSRGGYEEFPRRGAAFEKWCREHPPVLEDEADSVD